MPACQRGFELRRRKSAVKPTSAVRARAEHNGISPNLVPRSLRIERNKPLHNETSKRVNLENRHLRIEGHVGSPRVL